ncbi:MAG: VCBS domain-containing protein [Enhydrobacter sp.]|nr:VCBS domain-containing protein [Enhydrobacter sp.]
MATRNVPGTYATISAAVAASAAGDTIVVDASYAGNEAVAVTVNNLTFDAPANVTGIVLTAAAGILQIILAGASPIEIVGSSANNNFTGNTGANVISDGGGGNDTLKGGGGNDIVTVTGGTDIVDGGAGADDLLVVDYSTATASVTSGAAGASDGGTRTVSFDRVERLKIIGGSGADNLSGLSGNDILSGGEGNDTLGGGTGNNIVDGGNGNDTVVFSGGVDTVTGGAGDDVLRLDTYYTGLLGTMDGGTGTDTVRGFDLTQFTYTDVEIADAFGSSRMLVSVAQLATFNTITDSLGADNSQLKIDLLGAGTLDFSTRVSGAHSVKVVDNGLTGAVTLTGTVNADIMDGSSFDDTLHGGAGNDALYGGDGIDLLHGGAGNDTLYGNGYSATATYYDAGGGVKVSLATATAQNTLSAGKDTLSGITNLIGSAYDDQLAGDGSANRLDGGAGNDTLSGAAGSDVLAGGLGNDTLTGGGDIDTATYADATGAVTVSLSIAAAQNTGGGGTDTLATVENLVGSAHDDVLTGSGSVNRLEGGAGNDTVDGGAGDDALFGGAGNDAIDGGAGNDTLIGGGGDDVLTGGAGTDLINGNSIASPLYSGFGKYYTFVATNMYFSDAQALAQDLMLENAAGRLVTILSAAENAYVIETVASGSSFWLGASDAASEGAWFWLSSDGLPTQQFWTGDGSGMPVNGMYANWEPGDPDSTYDHVLANYRGDHFWVDATGNLDMGGMLVEWDQSAVGTVLQGNDTASYAASTGAVTIDLSTGLASGGDAAGDTLISIENLIGSANNDSLTGDGNANSLDGGAGNDNLSGGAGDDVLTGGAGDDKLAGGGGTDTASYATALGAVTVDLSVTGVAQNTGGGGNDTLATIENLTGSNFNDKLTGDANANVIDGSGGNDRMIGGGGNDTLLGGGGTDTAVVAASWLETTITEAPAGAFQLLIGGSTVSATGVERFQFTNGTFGAGAILNDAPIGADDSDSSLVEASGDTPGTPTATGNLLTNDTDVDTALGDGLGVTGIRTGTELAGGGFSTVVPGTSIAGLYGSLTLGPDGTWSYALDNANATVDALRTGETLTEVFTYRVSDGKGLTDTAQLSLTIDGRNDTGIVATDDRGYVSRGTSRIGEYLLTANDISESEEQPWFTAVSNAVNGSATLQPYHEDHSNVEFKSATDPALTNASFDYTVADGGPRTDTAHVSLSLVTTTKGNDTLTVPTLAGEFSWIDALGGNDTVSGGAGKDFFIGGAGKDILSGGADWDYLFGDAGADKLYGGDGDDYLQGGADADSLYGESGDDTLWGDDGNDVLDGGAGIDFMGGGAGNDTYIVNGVLDTVSEGAPWDHQADQGGMDKVEASVSFTLGDFIEHLTLTGNTAINGTGNALANVLTGNAAANILDGGDGTDTASYATATAGVTVNLGMVGAQNTRGAGTDTLLNVENLVGSSDGDTLTGDGNANVLDGGGGNDVLSGDGGSDTLNGGGGTDRAVISGAWLASAITAGPVGTYYITTGPNVVTATGVEKFQFTNGTFDAAAILNDAPIGADDSDSSLVEASGDAPGTQTATGNLLTNDTDADIALGDGLGITGIRTGTELAGGGFSTVVPGTLIAGLYGSLTLGPDGTWSYALDNANATVDALGAGQTLTEIFTYRASDGKGLTDTAQLSLTIDGSDDAPGIVAVDDHGYVSRGTSSIQGYLFNNDIFDSAEQLRFTAVGSAVNGTVSLLGEHEIEFVSTNDPALTTASFDYTLSDGGSASDTGHVSLNLITTTNGSDTVTAPTLADEFSLIDALAGNDTLTGGAGYDIFNGGDGKDTLVGGAGHDELWGGNEADRLYGGDDADLMFGNAGADKLYGEAGNDMLLGGAGSDTFIFEAGDSPSTAGTEAYDTIADFQTGFDKIDLYTIGGGGLSPSAYIETTTVAADFAGAASAATAAMADGLHSVVFVAGATDGWLFWNTDANLQTHEQAARLVGLNNVNAFQHGDLS